MLQNRYNNYLGNYKPGDVYAFSSPLNRSKVSLQYTLTGLYSQLPQEPTAKNIEAFELSTIPWETKVEQENFLRCLKFDCEKWVKKIKLLEKYFIIEKMLFL